MPTANTLPQYLARLYIDLQGDDYDRKAVGRELAGLAEDDLVLLRDSLQAAGRNVHRLSVLGRAIHARAAEVAAKVAAEVNANDGGKPGGNGSGNSSGKPGGNGNTNGKPPATSPLDALLESGRKQRRMQPRWGEEEWAIIVRHVSLMRLEEPTAPLGTIAELAQEHLPPHSRRTSFPGYVVQEVGKRLTEYNKRWPRIERDLVAANSELEARKAAPTREAILQSVTDDELVQRFAKRLLAVLPPDDLVNAFTAETVLSCIPTPQIVAYAAAQMLSEYSTHTRVMEENLAVLGRVLAAQPAESVRRQVAASVGDKAALPKVLLVGFKADQGAILTDRLHGRAKIEVQDKNLKHFAGSSADVILVLVKFTPTVLLEQIRRCAKPGCRVITHTGGLETAAQEIERALK